MIKKVSFFVILFVLGINLFLGIPRISRFSAVDEPYWTYDRTPKFWKSILAHKWKSTNVNDKPGITVATISGIGLLKVNPMDYKSLRGDPKTPEQMNAIAAVNFYMRLPIFLFIILMLPLFYFFLKKLFDEKIALLSFILIGLSPILLGMSLIINPDSLLWIFLPFSFFSYLIYQKNQLRKYLIWCGIFLGFALLTKYVANILYVFFLAIPFLEYIFAQEKPDLKKYLKKSLLDYAIIIFVSVVVFFIFFPATWKSPSLLLKGTFLSKAFETTWPIFVGILLFIALDTIILKSKVMSWILNIISSWRKAIVNTVLGSMIFLIGFVMVNTYWNMKFFDFEGILASPKGSSPGISIFIGKIMADVYSLIFGVSPIILISVILFLLYAIIRKKIDQQAKISLYFILFIELYYLASTVNSVVATVRYQIVLYPFFLIIGAFGLNKILFESKLKNFIGYIFSGIILISLIYSLFLIKPFYLTYASSLLPQKYILNSKDMGDGSYEAADYLNKLPGSENMTIWSDKGAVCESFKGKCVIGFTKKDLTGKIFDYFVVSSGRKSRTSKMGRGTDDVDFDKLYTSYQVEYQINFDNRPENYIKIIDGGIVYKNRAIKLNLDDTIIKNFPRISLKTPYSNNLEIIQPSFPNRICNITDYGAIEGGSVKNTDAIKNAISDCNGKGGGEVLIPNGKWLTGAIHLEDNINLHLADSAELIFSQDFNDYMPMVFSRFEGVEDYNFSPLIYANGKFNIAVTGKGTLNGQGQIWWKLDTMPIIYQLYAMGENNVPIKNRRFGMEKIGLRPAFIEFINSNVATIQDVKIIDGPMWTIHPTYSENVTIQGVSVKTDPGPSTDGVVIDSSRNVLVENSSFSTGDDSIVLKSGRDTDGLRVNWPTENVVIQNCTVTETHSGVAIGSEMSGGIRNIFVNNCFVDNAQYGFRIKTSPIRGGFVEKIWANNFTIRKAKFDAIQIFSSYEMSTIRADGKNYNPPYYDNINFNKFTSSKSSNAISIKGLEKNPTKNISFSNITMQSSNGITLENTDNIKFTNVNIATKYEPLYNIKNSTNITR